MTLKQEIQNRITAAQERLIKVKEELAKLQEQCSHPNQQSQLEYDFTAYWCADCDKHWSGRR